MGRGSQHAGERGCSVRRADQRSLVDRSRLALLSAVVGCCLLVLALGFAPDIFPSGLGDESDGMRNEFNETAVERHLFEAVNRERTDIGLSPVEYDRRLAGVARNHSEDMAAREYYAHETPAGLGPSDRVERDGLDCEAVGENIVGTWWQQPITTSDGIEEHTTREQVVESVVEQWLDSLSHRNNMLDPRWESTGVGVTLTPEGELLVTQKFCVPES